MSATPKDTSPTLGNIRKYAGSKVELMTMQQAMAVDSAARMAAEHGVQITQAAMDWMLDVGDPSSPDFAGQPVADREFPDFHDAWLTNIITGIAPRKIVRREDVAWDEAKGANS